MPDFKPRIIFRDPVFDGAADPTVIRRVSDGKLFMFYTQRRANIDCPDGSVEWCYGTKIGVAVCEETVRDETARGCHPDGEAGRIPHHKQTAGEGGGSLAALGMTKRGGFGKWEYTGALEPGRFSAPSEEGAVEGGGTPSETEGEITPICVPQGVISEDGRPYDEISARLRNDASVIIKPSVSLPPSCLGLHLGNPPSRLRARSGRGSDSPPGCHSLPRPPLRYLPEGGKTARLRDERKSSATFWAPEVVFDGESYRMFVTYIDGVFSEWAGEASIEQYISPDLLQWRRVGRVEIESARVIDPCLFPLPSGGWRMWYKDEKRGSRTCFCDTDDFVSWRSGGFATDETPQEGPNVFALGGYFWLVADVWDGLAVYRSDDLTRFVRQRGNILPGAASHADVFCEGGSARLVYFTYPGGGRRSAVCECGLTVKDGVLKAI